MHVKDFFRHADLDAIQDAVKDVEAKTSGEVVPYVLGTSGHYEEAEWKAAALGAFLGVLAAAAVHELGGFWGGWVAAWALVPCAVGATLGFLLAAYVPAIRRALIPAETLDRRVRLQADSAFVREEVFRTVDRTGVLVFLSLFERRVIVLADKGIAGKVGQHEWDGIVDEIVRGIRAGKPGEALASGIRRCGKILEGHHVARRSDDSNELPDTLRMRDE